MGHQQGLRRGLGEIAFGAFEFANKSCDRLGNGVPIIDEALREAEREQLALVIDEQVRIAHPVV
jgi:hypothetical protein